MRRVAVKAACLTGRRVALQECLAQSQAAERNKCSMEMKTRDGSKGWDGWTEGGREGGRDEEPPFPLQAPTAATPCLIPLLLVKPHDKWMNDEKQQV